MKVLFFIAFLLFLAIQMPETSAAKCKPGSVVGIGWRAFCPWNNQECHRYCRNIGGAGYTSGGCTAFDCQCRC